MKKKLLLIVVALAIMVPSMYALATSIEAFNADKKSKGVACTSIADGRCLLSTGADVKVDDDAIANCDDLAASSEQYTLPTANNLYEIRVTGNCASILCGASPTATTAKNGHWIKVCDGVPFRGVLTGAKCAHIAPSANGEICYIHFNPAL